MGRIGIFVCAVFMLAAGADQQPENMPTLIADESAADWLVDRFAGNSTAGPVFMQGPAREVGGLGRCGAHFVPHNGVVLVNEDDEGAGPLGILVRHLAI